MSVRHISWISLKYRKALARAVYARCELIVLDEPFSALDGATEHHVVESLLGPTGVLRQNDITVILMTNNGQYATSTSRTRSDTSKFNTTPWRTELSFLETREFN